MVSRALSGNYRDSIPEKEQTLVLDYSDIKKMINYSQNYGQGGFQGKLSTILDRIRKLTFPIRGFARGRRVDL